MTELEKIVVIVVAMDTYNLAYLIITVNLTFNFNKRSILYKTTTYHPPSVSFFSSNSKTDSGENSADLEDEEELHLC